MTEDPAKLPDSVRFEYPKHAWGLPLLCHLLISGLYCALYLPGQPASVQGTVLFVSAMYLVAVSVVIWKWPVRLFRKEQGIRIKEDGIVVDGRFAPWDDVERIECPWWTGSRGGAVLLKMKRAKGGFFSNPFKGPPKRLVLQGYPFVYRDVIPLIQRMRPDLPLSGAVRGYLAQPGDAGSPRTWLIFVALLLNVAMLSWLRSPAHHGLFDYLIVGNGLLILNPNFANLCIPLARNTRESFLQVALLCTGILGLAVQTQLWSPIERFAFQTLVVTGMVLMFVSVLVFFGTRKLSRAAQVWIAVVLLATPVVTYHLGRSRTWPVKNITSLMPEPPRRSIVWPLWGQSGVHLAGSPSKDLSHVIHVQSLTRKPVPERQGENDVVWLDERYLVRRVRAKEHASQLWVYDFSLGLDVRVPAADAFRIGQIRPVSHDGRCVAWIDRADNVTVQTLRAWDLETKKDERPPRRLPDDVSWDGPVWLTDGALALRGHRFWWKGDPKEYPLRVLRFPPGADDPERVVSSHRYTSWRVVWDFRYAFGLTEEGDDVYRAAFVDLETDEMVRLPGVGGHPHVVASSACSFRLAPYGNRNMLCRFDFETREEQPLHAVPDRVDICGISKTGRLALLVSGRFLQRPGCLVLHIPTGKRHWVYPRVLFGPAMPSEWAAMMPGLNPFSPDEQQFAVQTLGAESAWWTMLCTIPADWPGE